MALIYCVVSLIMAGLAWISSQLNWQYSQILMYVFVFLTSWFICLIFVYQEEFERTKNFTVITPAHLIFVVIDICLLIFLWKYDIRDFKTVRYAFFKVLVIMNLIQGCFLMLYYKLRAVYSHL